MSFLYKHVLILGGTSGIGRALAEKILESSPARVIVLGRRKERLDEFVQKHGKERASGIEFDVTQLDKIEGMLKKATTEHPDIDMIVVNSGISKRLDFTQPASIDLSVIHQELVTNYLSPLHFTKHILPHFYSKSTGAKAEKNTAIIYVTSALAIVPYAPNGNYCATKAGLHSLAMTTREELKGTNVKIVEILPPLVNTELTNSTNGMTLPDFTADTWTGLLEGKENIPVGLAVGLWDEIEAKRVATFEKGW